jgi:oleate hydratase
VRIDVDHEGDKSSIDLTENDLVFITNGGCVENSTMGARTRPPLGTQTSSPATAGICGSDRRQDPSFGHPEKFCSDPKPPSG